MRLLYEVWRVLGTRQTIELVRSHIDPVLTRGVVVGVLLVLLVQLVYRTLIILLTNEALGRVPWN